MRAFPTCSVLHLLPVPITDPCSCSWRCQSRTRHNIDNNKSISVDVGTMFNPYPSSFQNPSASFKPYFNFHFHFRFHFKLRCLPSSDSNDIEIQTQTETEDSIPYTSVDVDGVKIEIEKLPNNSRRIVSSVAIAAPLDAVWNVLTDYERLSDFIPNLAVSRLLLQSPNYARLFQIGEQDLALGLKFNAKGIIDCYEKPLEILSSTSGSGSALKRDIDFQMVQGDFEIFQGTWSLLQQLHMLETESETLEDGDTDTDKTTTTTTLLRYVVDVKPKLWLPVRLVEGRLCNDIKINLASIRQYAQKRSSFTL